MTNKSETGRSPVSRYGRLGVLVASAMLCFGLTGCADREAIEQNQAALELAEMKGDLDGMYLALRRLDELGIKDAGVRLPGIKMAVEAREQMMRAVADHDHERALLAANTLLDQIPDDKDALRTLRTSGLIFWYLQQAAEDLASFGQILDEPTVAPEDVTWTLPDNLTEEEHQLELNKFAQQALEDLGKYVGDIDGKIGPKTSEAISSFIEDEELAHSGEIDPSLVSALRMAARRKELKNQQIDLSFSNLAMARENIAKAKQLDPSFKNLVQLEEMTDGALSGIIYLQGAQIIEASESLVTVAGYLYQTIENSMSSTIGMRYLGPSDIWRQYEPVVKQFRGVATRTLDEVALINRRISQNGSGQAEDFTSAVNEFYLATKQAVEACTNPSGSLLDYRRDANAALQKYKESSDRLQNTLPTTGDIESSIRALATALESYSLYSDPAVEEIVAERVDDLTT